MKIFGARTEPFVAPRPRAGEKAAAAPRVRTPAARGADSTDFLGLRETDLTPQVKGAVETLLAEIDELRAEVGRLKAKLAETEGLADRDALTPVLNRRALMRELSRIRTFALRYGSAASLVYFDLDELKGVNDRFGHAAGDAALKAVAERLAANIRESDVVGRMGGDEFAVILAQTDAQTAEAKAQALARAVETRPVDIGGDEAALRVAYGVCEITEDLEPDEIVARADAVMYARKRARRALP
ncbi:GGDEF domain-containing protein [Phenylobacterium sp.]|uniref:GGDEF domain-containing protein n=1 Tax=Phenylobacterium sp. TaxID=1871053 RepID=UPI002FDF73C9